MKIDVREGFGEFVDAHTLKITPVEGEPYTVSFGAAVIATGAPAFVPPIPGARENLANGGVVTSDTIWNLSAPPKKMAIIGGGVIGVEMAQIFRDFGTEILMLERNERILGEIEDEIGKTLIGLLEKEISVVTSASIDGASGTPGKMNVAYKNAAGEAYTFACDIVLMATGKRPDTSKLNLDKVGRRTRRRRNQGQHARPDQRAAHLRGGRRDRRLHAGAHRRHAGPCRRRQPAWPRLRIRPGQGLRRHLLAPAGRLRRFVRSTGQGQGHRRSGSQDADEHRRQGDDHRRNRRHDQAGGRQGHGPDHRRALPRRPHRHPDRYRRDDGGRRHDADPGGQSDLPAPRRRPSCSANWRGGC